MAKHVARAVRAATFSTFHRFHARAHRKWSIHALAVRNQGTVGPVPEHAARAASTAPHGRILSRLAPFLNDQLTVSLMISFAGRSQSVLHERQREGLFFGRVVCVSTSFETGLNQLRNWT